MWFVENNEYQYFLTNSMVLLCQMIIPRRKLLWEYTVILIKIIYCRVKYFAPAKVPDVKRSEVLQNLDKPNCVFGLDYSYFIVK